MKRAITIFAILMITLCTCFAQSKRYVYCEISPVGKFFKGGCTLKVNYGQAMGNIVFTKKTRVCDESGRPLNFNNRVDALNWLSEKGWEYCSSTTTVSGSDGDSSSRETWILKYCVDDMTDEQIQAIYGQFNVKEP